MINIYTLNNTRDMREKKREQFYKRVLTRCYNRIKITSKNRTFCFFKIPNIVFGIPIFNTEKCSNYVFNILIKKGFKVSQVKGNCLLIYWGHIPSYVSEPNLKMNNVPLIKQQKKENYRNINDVDDNNNFIYDLPELNEKIKRILQ